MIIINNYPNIVDTDLSYCIDAENNMNLVINFTKFKDELNNIINDKGEISIPFQADTKYDKMVSIFLTSDNRFIIDEVLDDVFYIATIVPNSVDKICWFTIPVNYNNPNGLNDIEICCKGGNANVDDTQSN